MKLKKLVLEFGITAAAAAIISVPATVSAKAAETASETINEANSEYGTEPAEDAAEESEDQESAENAAGETEQEPVEITGEIIDEEASGWENKLLVVVGEDTSLNVRKEAGTDSEIVGKLYRGGTAEVIEKGEEWSKIVSGDVEGYVKNEYCLFDEEAEAKAEEICDTEATVTTDGVRVRSEASEESTIYGVLEEGDSLTVSENGEETADGWIQVEYGGSVAYVSADYVEVGLGCSEAVSMEEVYEQQAAAVSSQTTAASGTAVSASSDDLTLLAALIQCEAGGESYEGKLAVGAVVMNRVKSGSFPNTISGVIYQSGQFSPASNGKLSRVISSGSISSGCYQAAQAAMNGEDNTGGAKYFHAGSSGGTVIGNQVFY